MKNVHRFHNECLKNGDLRTVIIIIIKLIASNERENERVGEREKKMSEKPRFKAGA